MAWSGGAQIAAATAANRDGTRNGAGPLRQALDELRDAIAPLTEEEGAKLFKDVWAARDGYIQVILYRTDESVDRFFMEHQNHGLTIDGAGARARVDGDAAACAVDVHELRMVLRRYLGN